MASYLNTQNPSMTQPPQSGCVNCQQNAPMAQTVDNGMTVLPGESAERLWGNPSQVNTNQLMNRESSQAPSAFPAPSGQQNPLFDASNIRIESEEGMSFVPNHLTNFLRSQIGKLMEIQFLMGSGGMTERSGKLVVVGNNYVVLEESGRNSYIACDYYSIKFVRVLS